MKKKRRSFPEVVLDLLRSRSMKLAVAESCTGGTLGKLITDIPGSSDVFVLSVVTYANEMKKRLLGVSDEVLARHGAVSKACAKAMAEGVRKLSGADLAVSITGIAGPSGGTKAKPVGTVWFGLSSCKETLTVRRFYPKRARLAVRTASARFAIQWIRQYLRQA
jgi:PncC family amidohydrolase